MIISLKITSVKRSSLLFQRFHSTETALLKVQDDILQTIDNQKCVALLLLDLSATFDTVDHQLLVERLRSVWSERSGPSSYLENRTQVIMVDGVKSAIKKKKNIICGVPEGSVLGPLLYELYTAPVAYIIRRHGLGFHL